MFSQRSLQPQPMRPSRNAYNVRSVVFMFLLLGLCGLGCTLRMSRKQLDGADPWKDMAAAPLISQLKQLKGHQLSVNGVRLLAPIKRAFLRWGQPKRRGKGSYVWTDTKGRYLLRALTALRIASTKNKDNTNDPEVIQRIDIFAAYRSQLHPKNHVLFAPASTSSATWRRQIFGAPGVTLRSPLKEQIRFDKQGFRLLQFSTLLPEGRQLCAAFSLLLPSQLRDQLRLRPLP